MLSGFPISGFPLSSVAISRTLAAAVGTFALVGNDARFNPTGFPVETGSFTLTGQDATLSIVRPLILERGSFVLTGNDALGARNGVSGSGTFVLTGQTAGLTKGPILAIETGEFVFTGNIVALTADIRVSQLGAKAVNTLISPTNFATGQLDANTIRSNDNIVAQALTSHDSDATIHVQSGDLSRRPVAPSEGATWVATDTQDTYMYIGGQWVQTGWAHWYGDFYDTTDQAIATINTEQLVTLNSTGATRGVALISGSQVRATYAGDYNIMFSAQIKNTDSAEYNVYFWWKKNGTNIADTAGQITVPKKHGSGDGHLLAMWNVFVPMAANDYLQLYWQGPNTMLSLETIPSAGSVPRVPSVIVTINRI